MASQDLQNRLRIGLASPSARDELLGLLYGVSPFATAWYADATDGADTNDGESSTTAKASVQAAIDLASAGDVVFLAPGEYNEDVVIATAQITVIGAGPRHSVRITGTAAGTATAVTIDGVNEVSLLNLNMEGRSGGSGLLIGSGQVRRVSVFGCKMHGGDNGLFIDAGNTGQVVDVIVEDFLIGPTETGVNLDQTSGDPMNQLHLRHGTIQKCSAACVAEGAAFVVDFVMDDVTCTDNNGVEPTVFLDLDTTSTTGFITNCRFATDVFDSTDFAIATGVIFAQNYTQAEGSSSTATGTASGRPN
jgi:hypothetical protein